MLWPSMKTLMSLVRRLALRLGRGVGLRLRRLVRLHSFCVVRSSSVREVSSSGLCLVRVVSGKFRRGVDIGGSLAVRRTAVAPSSIAALSFPGKESEIGNGQGR